MFSYAAFADYILMNPSAEYEEIMARVHEKIYLSKVSYLVVPHTLTTHRIPHTVYHILYITYCIPKIQWAIMLANHSFLSFGKW